MLWEVEIGKTHDCHIMKKNGMGLTTWLLMTATATTKRPDPGPSWKSGQSEAEVKLWQS